MKKKLIGYVDGRPLKSYFQDQELRRAITRPAMTICNMVESNQIQQAATACLGDDVTKTGRAELIVLGMMIGYHLTEHECLDLVDALLGDRR